MWQKDAWVWLPGASWVYLMNSVWFSNVLLIGLTLWCFIHVVCILIFGEYTVKEPRKYVAIFEMFLLLAIAIFALRQLH